MSDDNAIARLYAWPPQNILAAETLRRSRFTVSPPHELSVAPPFGRNDDLVTPINSSAGTTLNQPLNPHIRISFDMMPKTSHGIVFGCGRDCDVVLPDQESISAHHFSISFDEQGRLIVRDLNSTAGIEVIFGNNYKGVPENRRRNFQWLVEGSSRIPRSQVIIHVGSNLSFRLVPEKHSMPQNVYMENVNQFRQGSGTAQALSKSINMRLQREPRSMNRGMWRRLKSGPIYEEAVLGQGGFGRAKYMWNVSTGKEVVLKEPIDQDTISLEHLRKWKEEALTMQKLPHENILKLLDAKFLPWPQLFLEYCPGGTLRDIADELGAIEILQVLQQALAGLQFAHQVGIAHRDLKLDNILVASRSPLKIKIADFGIAKNVDQLQSFCGTRPYIAPDIWAMGISAKAKHYTKAVDIWSLGVVVYDLLFGLPGGYGSEFCSRIVSDLRAYLQANHGTIAEFLAKYMLKLREADRSCAAACHRSAMVLPTPTDRVVRARTATFSISNFSNNTLDGYPCFLWHESRKRTAECAESSELDSQPCKRRLPGKQRRSEDDTVRQSDF